MKKVRYKKIITIIVIVVSVVLPVYAILNFIFPLDFSQDYRAITGVENIIFQSSADCCYRRCFWGLGRTDVPALYEPHTVPESNREIEVEELRDYIGDVQVRQALFSPDGNYILYCEIEYGYKKSGLTDDEYCYYKVYDIETKEVTVLYGGYREWYNLDWQ